DADALLRIQRIGDPQVSPDGKTVAFAVSTPDLVANRSVHSIWSVPLAGGPPKKLADQADRPRWSPDGAAIYFTGMSSGNSQTWSIKPDGSGARQITHLSTEAANHIVSPDGRYLVMTSDVFPDCGADDACNTRHLQEARDSKVSARLITGL